MNYRENKKYVEYCNNCSIIAHKEWRNVVEDKLQFYSELENYYLDAEKSYRDGYYHQVIGKLQFALYQVEKYEIEPNELIGKMYLILFRSHNNLKHYDKVLESCDQVSRIFIDIDNHILCELYSLKAFALTQKNRYQQATLLNFEILNVIKDDFSKYAVNLKVITLYNQANIYLRKKDLQKAKANYLSAFKLLKKHNNDLKKGRVLLGLGYIFHLEKKLDFTERCYLLAKKYLTYELDPITYGRLLHNLGELYLEIGKIEESRRYFSASLDEKKLYKSDRIRVAGSLRGVASTYLGEDIYSLQEYCLQALNLILKDKCVKFSAKEEEELGQIYLLLSNYLYQKKNFADLKLYLSRASLILEKHNLTHELDKVKKLEQVLDSEHG